MAPDPSEERSLRARQSEVSRTGKAWESYVAQFISTQLTSLKATSPSSIIADLHMLSLANRSQVEKVKQTSKKLYDSLVIHIYQRGYELIGDVDIVLYSQKYEYPIVIVSCKLSLHGRLTESLFYSLYYRLTRKIRFVLATPDKGKQASETWESEWGTEEQPSKDRILASVFLDGVYVQNAPTFMPSTFDPQKQGTHTGGIVKPLNQLLPDTIRWYEEFLSK